jgi:preprotein translocase subunit SecF
MEFFKIRRDIPFMSHALVFNVISVITFVLAVFFLIFRGLNLGVDFTGGTLLEVHYAQSAELQEIRKAVADLGIKDASVQNFGTSQDVLVRLPAKIEIPGDKVSEVVMEALKKQEPSAELRRVEFVGPQVGRELMENGIYALLAVCLGIVFYLWMRFEWKFGLAAIIANLHDVVIILGFFAFFQWDFCSAIPSTNRSLYSTAYGKISARCARRAPWRLSITRSPPIYPVP